MEPTYDPTDLHGQERKKADAEAQQRLALTNEQADFKWLMSSRRGRRLVWRLLEFAGVFQTSFDLNARLDAFNQGNKNYGLRIWAMVQALTPELYPTMQKENANGNDDGNADHSN